jgi:hypothetical protein
MRPIYIFDHLFKFFVEWETSQTKAQKFKTHIFCSVTCFKTRTLYKIIWKGIVDPDRRVRIACWISKATNKHSEYVLLLAFSVQQLLHERALTLCHTYFACLLPKFRT